MTAIVTVKACDETLCVSTSGYKSTKSVEGNVKTSSNTSTFTKIVLEPGQETQVSIYEGQTVSVRLKNKYDDKIFAGEGLEELEGDM